MPLLKLSPFLLLLIMGGLTTASEEETNHEFQHNRILLSPDDFYVDMKDVMNPHWADLKANLTVGENSFGPAYGSTIHVVQSLVERGRYRDRKISEGIVLHTPTHSHISKLHQKDMTRWYQEHGAMNTQIFRMLPGDDNVRNQRLHAPRVEAYSPDKKWKEGDGWHEWSARFTFVRVRAGAVFQIKHNATYWSMQLRLEKNSANIDNDTFDLVYAKLRDPDAKTVLARNVVARSGVDIKVLDNGVHHEVYVNGILKVENSMTDRGGSSALNHARWGFYSAGSAIDREILVFVTGVYVGKAL